MSESSFVFCLIISKGKTPHKSVSKRNDLDCFRLTRSLSFELGPQNCITKLFTIIWKWLNIKTLKRYLTGKRELDGTLSVRNPFISVNSKSSCREQNVFPGHQATRHFLIWRNCIQEFESNALYRQNKLHYKRLRIPVTTPLLKLGRKFDFTQFRSLRSLGSSKSGVTFDRLSLYVFWPPCITLLSHPIPFSFFPHLHIFGFSRRA